MSASLFRSILKRHIFVVSLTLRNQFPNSVFWFHSMIASQSIMSRAGSASIFGLQSICFLRQNIATQTFKLPPHFTTSTAVFNIKATKGTWSLLTSGCTPKDSRWLKLHMEQTEKSKVYARKGRWAVKSSEQLRF